MISTSSFTDSIRTIVNDITGSYHDFIPLHAPSVSSNEVADVIRDCLASGWVSSAGGHWLSLYESKLSEIVGSANLSCMSCGTDALRMALYLVGVQPGDEVIMPSLSFVATANAVSHLHASPYFIDISLPTLSISPEILDHELTINTYRTDAGLFNKHTNNKISCICVVHVLGIPAEIDELCAVAKRWNLPLVEDAAEALGSFYKSTHCGLFGMTSALSFNGNKIITTGSGGCLITNSEELITKGRHLASTAKVAHPYEFIHDQIAWNDRMAGINAALGLGQISAFEKILSSKRELFTAYDEYFSQYNQLIMFKERPNTQYNYWLSSLLIDESDDQKAYEMSRQLLHAANNAGVCVRPLWKPLHLLPMYETKPRSDMHKTLNAYYRVISLPSSPYL